ncbi:MAG: PH domain-containing protein [Gemmatimonadota bacterium]|jgi:putative membrane protein
MNDPRVLREARFNPKVRSYWLLNGSVVLLFTVVGIPLLPVWWILGQWFTARYLERITCTLTERSLKVTRGILVRREMTVPLDKITDVGLVEGPIMRSLDLQALRIETAGQSTAGAAVQLVGIENGRGFRDEVLRQRDRVAEQTRPSGSRGAEPVAGVSPAGMVPLLAEIRDSLHRIEARLPEPDPPREH